jgi:hypothetical protein
MVALFQVQEYKDKVLAREDLSRCKERSTIVVADNGTIIDETQKLAYRSFFVGINYPFCLLCTAVAADIVCLKNDSLKHLKFEISTDTHRVILCS